MYDLNRPWRVTSSYQEPVAIPADAPGDGPGVSVCFNRGWLPYVIGCLLQLAQPAAWDSTDATAISAVLNNVNDLIKLFGTAGGCMELRWSTSDCAIQVSTDNGATWADITDWSLPAVQACIMAGLTIRVDAGGNLQWSIDGGTTWIDVSGWPPGTPPNPGGESTGGMACNIATHLAQNIIQGALTAAVNGFNDTISEAVAAASIVALIPVYGPEIALTIDAAAGITYLIYHSGSIGDFATAAADPVLAHKLQCAIYNAIFTDGAVTAANYSAVASAIAAIAYTPTDVQTAINGFISDLGLNGLLAAQQLGGLVAGDCTGCGAGGVALFNGTNDLLTGTLDDATYTGDLGMCVWIRHTSATDATLILNGPTPFHRGCFHVSLRDTAGAFPHSARGDSNAADNQDVTASNNAAVASQWHLVGVNWPAAGGVATISIDGVNQPVTHVGVSAVGSTVTNAIYVGGFLTGSTPTWPYAGKMADLRVYHSLLTNTQLLDITAAGVNAYLPVGTPRHWWKFDEGTGSTAHDSGASPADLTWQGSGTHWSTV